MTIVLTTVLPVTRPTTAVAEPPDDARLREALYTEFLYDDHVPDSGIDVDVHEGIVELTGTLDNAAARHAAVAVAERVRGVLAVVDRLRVAPSSVTDAEITARVTAALLADPVVDFGRVTVEVEGGVVDLRGSVESDAQRRHALDIAREIHGVRSVAADLTVKRISPRTPDQIADEIALRFEDDATLRRRTLDVSVDADTVAHLTGHVASVEEVGRARELSWVRGVRDVMVDDVTVDPDQDVALRPGPPDRDDDAIHRAVVDALSEDPRIGRPLPEVEVEDATVTLRGAVATPASREAAVEDALRVAGVASVVPRLDVVPVEIPDDAALVTSIRAALGRDAWLYDDDVTAKVLSGRVDLYGRVETPFERLHAERLVGRIAGVISTENHLEVLESDAERPSDAALTQAVEDQLWWSTRVDARDVDVAVEGGVAVLTGNVPTWAERRAAADEARQTAVTRVVNEIEVGAVPPPPPVIDPR